MAKRYTFERDISGQRFGRLTALRKVNKTGKAKWLCQCECGNTAAVSLSALRRKPVGTRSCGCLAKEIAAKRRKEDARHGMYKTRTYSSWHHMKQRCKSNDPRQRPYYLDRGITVCERWASSFEAFVEDMGVCPSPIHSIDRIDNDKGYEPDNCRWATPKEQSQNRRVVRDAKKRREEARRARDHARRVFERTGLGSEKFSAKEIFERDGWRCQICGKKVRRDVHGRHPLAASLDHIVPIARGGTHSRRNAQTSHLQCNIRKQATRSGQLRLFG